MLLANLLDNALRYTPEGGRIDVAVDDDAGHAVLIVADTGPGIPASDRERVFDRFHRGAHAGEREQTAAGSGSPSSSASPTPTARPSRWTPAPTDAGWSRASAFRPSTDA